jgi:polyisoprenoid-binding protein YceI
MNYTMPPVSSVRKRGWMFVRSALMVLGAFAIDAAGWEPPAALAAAADPSAAVAATEPSSSAATQPSGVQYVSSAKSGDASVTGTSTLHNWTVTGATINGTAAFAGEFDSATPPAIQSIQLVIPVNSLKSGEGGGMDGTMDDALKMKKNPNLTYSLVSATLTSGPTKDDPQCHYAAIGQLTIAGWMKTVNLTLDVRGDSDGTLTIATKTPLKMTDYGMDPPTAMLGTIRSGDAVTVNITWQLAKKTQ